MGKLPYAFIALSLWSVSASFTVRADARLIEGAVSTSSAERATFRTAQETLELNLSALTPETRRQIGAATSRQRLVLSIPASAILQRAPVPMEIRPNCTELPLSYEELIAKATSPNVTSMLDFLRSIPAGTMQTFTLAHHSQSAQREGVTKKWPRVIRMSIDGHLTFAYTCNPSSSNYGTVEVMRFDESTRSYQLTELDFRGSQNGGAHVRENPSSCLSCHSTRSTGSPDPRPNWAQYPNWPGFYGGLDDHLYLIERFRFRKFREAQVDNPCYATLPWPRGAVTDEYSRYPYSVDVKSGNYDFRPNLRITDIQSHLMAQRLARLFEENSVYQRHLKYLLVMESLGCPSIDYDREIQAVLPRYRSRSAVPYSVSNSYSDFPARFDPRRSRRFGARLYETGRALGLSPADWTMHFDQPDDPGYQTGIGGVIIPSPRDIPIARVLQALLLSDLSRELPELMPYFSLGRGVEQAFGEEFACIDRLGGEIISTREQRGELCMRLGRMQQELTAQRAVQETASAVFDFSPQRRPASVENACHVEKVGTTF